MHAGEAWTELAALHLDVDVVEVSDEAVAARVHTALDKKYAALAAPADRLPRGVRALYAERVVLRLDPVGRELSWANAKIRLAP